ncbi:MAG: dimethylargininase [Chloroflexi bacterium]|nr:dimethylargininase [Chloroflexota bacterium]
MPIAITREVSPNMYLCELTHLAREPIDSAIAKDQHSQYERCLSELGCDIQRLPAEADLPDSVFVEDAAIVLDEIAIITRPGAQSRRPETQSIAKALEPYRSLEYITAPGTLDGGDVLRIDKTIFVGNSTRSNQGGIEQLEDIVAKLGYSVETVEMGDCLHLKSAVTQVAENTLLINQQWVEAAAFEDFNLIEIEPAEPFAANALLLGEVVVFPSSYPNTQKRLQDNGFEIRLVDVAEFAKAEGGVTCCSLIFEP